MSVARELSIIETRASSGQPEKATELLLGLLERNPKDEKLVATAINMLLSLLRYKEALIAYDEFHSLTGRSPRTDISREEIASLVSEQDKAGRGREKDITFARLTFWKRGHFSNLPNLLPVRKITFTDRQLIVQKGFSTYQYPYADVSASVRTLKSKYKSYGAGTGGRYTQRIMELRTKDKVFQFDVSSSFPDFERSLALEKEIEARIGIE